MKVSNYIVSLLPSFEKRRVMEDIRVIRQELTENTLLPYQAADEFFNQWDFISGPVRDFDKRFQSRVKTDFKGNYVRVTYKVLNRISDNLDTLEALVDNYFSKDIMREGMTYLKANLLQYVETITFAMRYSRSLLRWTYAMEVAEQTENRELADHPLTPAEMQWLAKAEGDFGHAIRILSGTKRDLKKAVDDIPDVVINPDNADVVTRTLGLSKVDPLQIGLISSRLNPIYHIRMAVAEWQVQRYKTVAEERRLIEYRLMQMKELQKDGHTDARLGKNIEYTESRLEKMNYRLHRMEEKYA